MNFSISAIEASPHWLEQLNWGSQILLVVLAIGTLVFAWWQVQSAAADRSQQLKISQATLLLELDARWDSAEIKEARGLIADLLTQTKTMVGLANPVVSDKAKQTLLETEWRKQLQSMRDNSEEGYLKLLGLCGFFETVGLMVQRGYVAEEDIMELFKGPLVDIHTVFGAHICERRNEMGVPNGLFEHALNLAAKAAELG